MSKVVVHDYEMRVCVSESLVGQSALFVGFLGECYLRVGGECKEKEKY